MDNPGWMGLTPLMASDDDKKGHPRPQRFRSRVEEDFVEGFESIGSPAFFRNVAATFREDCVLICNSPRAMLQIGGEHRGLPATIAALRSFFIEFEVSATSVDDIIIDGAHVVVNYNMSLRHVGTSRSGIVRGLNRYVLDTDRRIVKCDIFFDNASLAAIGDMLDTFAETARGLDLVRRPHRDPEAT
jgi:hypothetical protein